MDFVEAVDYGDAPEFFVSGVSRITRVNQNIVRLTFFSVRQQSDGTIENRAVHHQVWDIGEWLRAVTSFRAGREMAQSRHAEPTLLMKLRQKTH